MIWSYLSIPLILGLAYALFVLLRITLARLGSNRFSSYSLGLVGFALIVIGNLTLDMRDGFPFDSTVTSQGIWTGRSFFDDFGQLLIVSGVVFLFILFCVSLSRPNAKLNEKTENKVAEYLK